MNNLGEGKIMLWIEVLQKFGSSDVEVVCKDGLHFRGPLLDESAMQFCEVGNLFTLKLDWTKRHTGSGNWVDYEPKTIEVDTTLTRIREAGGGRIRMNMVIRKPPIPPSENPQLETIGEITLHPPDEETAKWHALVGPPVLAMVVV